LLWLLDQGIVLYHSADLPIVFPEHKRPHYFDFEEKVASGDPDVAGTVLA